MRKAEASIPQLSPLRPKYPIPIRICGKQLFAECTCGITVLIFSLGPHSDFRFKQNQMLTGSRLPVGPTSDLNDIFPAEFTPKGTRVDPNRQYPWAAAEQMTSRPTVSPRRVQVMDYVLVPPAPYSTTCLNYDTPPSGAVAQTCRPKYRASRRENKEGVPMIL